ncbi:MAG: tripartite tricarboxylate transporter TctB family protein, partial [Desulfobacterales bacterium]|nr:tripartite tricarboxylate transporter TctB family protein [Desulfobacterales bacterium]
MTTNIQERAMAMGICAAALFLLYLSMDFPMESRVFPIAVLSLMAILAAVVFLRSFLKSQSAEQEQAPQPFFIHRNRFSASFACIFGYIVLLPILGYFTTSAIFFVAMTWFLGFRSYKATALTIFIFLSFIYIVFVLLFERPIP